MHSLQRYASAPRETPHRRLVEHHDVLVGVQHVALPGLLHGFLRESRAARRRCSSRGCRSAAARAPTHTGAAASCRTAAPSPRTAASPPRPARPRRGTSAPARPPAGCSTVNRGNGGNVHDEGVRGGPLHAQVARQPLVVFDLGLQAVGLAEGFLGDHVEFV